MEVTSQVFDYTITFVSAKNLVLLFFIFLRGRSKIALLDIFIENVRNSNPHSLNY